jgi:hypothetical protein
MSAWKDYKAKIGVTRPWDFLNPNTEYTSDEEESTRYSLCMECPEFIKPTTQCKQCGCIMKAKVKLKYATCPIGKW